MRMTETMPTPRPASSASCSRYNRRRAATSRRRLKPVAVLRDRKKMKDKVQALSMEAKASAFIIGALPFIVSLLVYLSSPSYITPLFTTTTGHIILGVSGVWMSIGIFVMRQMMNFEV